MQPSGLARRYAAWSLDAVPLLVIACVLCASSIAEGRLRCAAALAQLADGIAQALSQMGGMGPTLWSLSHAMLGEPAIAAAAHALAATVLAMLWPPVLVFALAGLAFHGAFEASPWQATPGKRWLELRVVDARGGRVGWPRALLRHATGIVSWCSLNLGHVWAAVPPRHVAWHDVIARARVVQVDRCGRLPRWACAWLLLQAAIACAALVWLLETTNAALWAAFAGTL